MVDVPRPFDFLIEVHFFNLFFFCDIFEVLQIVQVCIGGRKLLFRSSQGDVQSLYFRGSSVIPISLRFVWANVLV